MLMLPGVARCAEQAERVERKGAMVMQDAPEQEDLPPDSITPVTSPDDLWAQLPEGKRGRGWTEPMVLDDPEDASKPSRALINFADPPGRTTTMFISFVAAYNGVVADYLVRHHAQEDGLCGQIDEHGNPLPTPAYVSDEAQESLAKEFGWGVDHARDLRRAARAMFLARTQGMHPYVGDVRLVRGATDRRRLSVVDSKLDKSIPEN